ncbi:hypothetical protein Taro_027843 [Colocasia esculenta]|uniref:Uncharacterized protein n=1 Tax=Colocasia esculenta TaxID=4460 RepID=A0A843VNN9_COLES|nr:hypothetical protein [Colocasia esculenta]
MRSVIHEIIDDGNEIRSVSGSPDLENKDVGHESNDEVNELRSVLGCPDLENKDVAPFSQYNNHVLSYISSVEVKWETGLGSPFCQKMLCK